MILGLGCKGLSKPATWQLANPHLRHKQHCLPTPARRLPTHPRLSSTKVRRFPMCSRRFPMRARCPAALQRPPTLRPMRPGHAAPFPRHSPARQSPKTAANPDSGRFHVQTAPLLLPNSFFATVAMAAIGAGRAAASRPLEAAVVCPAAARQPVPARQGVARGGIHGEGGAPAAVAKAAAWKPTPRVRLHGERC